MTETMSFNARPSQAALKERAAAELTVVRGRSLGLIDPLPEHEQVRQHSSIMSPLIWDLAHVGNYEDIWLLRAVGRESVDSRYDDMYNAALHPRSERPQLPLLGPGDARRYIAEVRGRVLGALEDVELREEDPLLRDAFVYGMVIQHEHQHDETILATLQLMEGDGYARYAAIATPPPVSAPPLLAEEVYFSGGPVVIGTDDEPWAYDNERGAHTVDLAPFFIDATPVTNGQFLRFVEDGGYHEPRYWDERGWRARVKGGFEHPMFWQRDGGGWSVVRFGRREFLRDGEPVQHVSWYEADAYARWCGKRLPTEPEWEAAASWDPAAGRKYRYPWGDREPDGAVANLGQRHFGPATAGALPEGASPIGARQMIGDVWEWTASDFLPYPGFVAFPYPEYSEVFFGPRYKVLRGGSWATHPAAIRATFRNWDLPVRRQIFAGFRCARDA
ncbi:MAG TPA: ergothioneine biosynthesis protein EgtB [Actinomycetota bacterium]|nr:ergothioneine biosynthesis protein EgtB [Actinomycetota bacterium]